MYIIKIPRDIEDLIREWRDETIDHSKILSYYDDLEFEIQKPRKLKPIDIILKDIKILNNILILEADFQETVHNIYLAKLSERVQLPKHNPFNLMLVQIDKIYQDINNVIDLRIPEDNSTDIDPIDLITGTHDNDESKLHPINTLVVPSTEVYLQDIKDDLSSKQDIRTAIALVESEVELEKQAADFSPTVLKNNIRATAGQILMNELLPEDLRDYNRLLDKKGMSKLMQNLANKYPDKYTEISHNVRRLADNEGIYAMRHLHYDDFNPVIDVAPFLDKADKLKNKYLKEYKGDMGRALAMAYGTVKEDLTKAVIAEGVKKDNALALMAVSGSKGKPVQITDTISTPLMVTDFKNRPIPIIIDKSYTQGLTPAQYWAQSYGSRRGAISTKLATPKAGYMSKMLGWSMNNILITQDDCKTDNGIVCPVDDNHNIGRYLAANYGGFSKNTQLDEKILAALKNKHIEKIQVRSPITCETEDGVCKICMGRVETGKLPEIGYNAGINAAAALSEPLSQGMLSEKHTGGAIKKRVGGFPLISRLLEIPTKFPDKVRMSTVNGKVSKIEKAPWGGTNISIEGETFYVPETNTVKVKEGDVVEKGSHLSDGIPNPAEVTELRGAGEGRISLTNSLRDAYDEMGMRPDRVHFEMAGKAFINYGKNVGDREIGFYAPNTVGKLSSMLKGVEVRNKKVINIKDASPGAYLLKPVLHYSIGTELTPNIIKDIRSNGITEISITSEKIPIVPIMVRVQNTALVDEDWMAKLESQGLKGGILEAVHKGQKSPYTGTSFVHPYVRGITFGLGKYY